MKGTPLLKKAQTSIPSDTNVSNSEYGAFNYTTIGEYRLSKVLGQGAYAVVKEGTHKVSG